MDPDYPATRLRAEAAREHIKPEGFGPGEAIDVDDHLPDVSRRLRDRVEDLAGGGAVQPPMQSKHVPRPRKTCANPETRSHHS